MKCASTTTTAVGKDGPVFKPKSSSSFRQKKAVQTSSPAAGSRTAFSGRPPSDPPTRPLPPTPDRQQEDPTTLDVKLPKVSPRQEPDTLVDIVNPASNMRRAFSRRNKGWQEVKPPSRIGVNDGGINAAAVDPNAGASTAVHSRNRSLTYNNLSGLDDETSQKNMSRREKIVRAITNPDTIFRPDPSSPPPESRFNPNPNGKLVRAFFSNSLDVAPTHNMPPSPPSPSTDVNFPIFDAALISSKVAAELPAGYTIRPLCPGDYRRGYMDVVRILGRTGVVSQTEWDQRVDWLREQRDTYYIIVVEDEEGIVVASGALMIQRKFINNLGKVGCIDDLAVARSQKGKKMGLRVLEALVHVAVESGCYQSVVHCSEANEAFHAQCSFVREGSMMVLKHASKPAAASD